jgi:hypothetical protein
MSELTNKRFAQPYGGEDALTDFLHPSRTATQLADIADSINTKDKVLGKRCFESTNQLDYIADGPAPDDTWTLNNGLGLTQVTPSV